MATEIILGRKTPLRFYKSSDNTLQNDNGQLPPAYLSLDTAPRESHRYENQVSTYPVEAGATISDFIRRVPETLIVDGFITNAPIPYLDAQTSDYSSATTTPNKYDRVRNAFEMLLQIAGYKIGELGKGVVVPAEALLVDIVTGLRAYTNMVLVSLEVPRDGRTGDALRFTAEFRRMDKVQLQTVLVTYVVEKKPAAINAANQASNTTDSGAQGTDEATVKQRSAARKVLDTAAGILNN